ncbi:MAG: response regulator, partial [Terriglobales bacterium]
MAKILVADDNSNIQKMVGLALKDQGIEVIAVGNGEAAVRKIPDVQPDVVLADVFMPVRNGYEVCEFIKKSDKFSHIPVILLVGAFDPLDEQEAQRVGADGVLKKPFVPPDPLISMVKSALARAGARAAVPVAVGVSSSAAAPVISSIPSAPPSEFAAPEPLFRVAEEIPARPAPFSIDEGHAPLAFGNLLDTATAEKQEEADESFAPARGSGLPPERSWNAPAAEAEEEPEEMPAWRMGVDDLFDSPVTATTSRVSDWRDTVPGAPQDSMPAVEASPAVEGVKPMQTWQSAPASPSTKSPFTHGQNEQAPVSLEPKHVEEAEAPPSEPFSPPSSFTPENFPGLFVEEKAALAPPQQEATEEPFVEQEFIPPAGSRGSWEEEVRRAARLVTSWETAGAPHTASPSSEFASPASE